MLIYKYMTDPLVHECSEMEENKTTFVFTPTFILHQTKNHKSKLILTQHNSRENATG
jgi:hypothetical protein